MDFPDLVRAHHEQAGESPFEGTLLCFDPGHTTGFAIFRDLELITCGQLDTDDLEKATHKFMDITRKYKPDMIVYESYRVYKWRAKHHAGSEVLTAQIIGSIQTVCHLKNIEYTTQPAHIGKAFCTDAKLKKWGYWQSGMRHARDAIRHGCYYLLFGAVRDPNNTPTHTKGGHKGKTVG